MFASGLHIGMSISEMKSQEIGETLDYIIAYANSMPEFDDEGRPIKRESVHELQPGESLVSYLKRK